MEILYILYGELAEITVGIELLTIGLITPIILMCCLLLSNQETKFLVFISFFVEYFLPKSFSVKK